MSAFPQQRKKLFLAQRFSRLVVRLRDPEWQRYGKVLFLGKALGVGVVLLVVAVVMEGHVQKGVVRQAEHDVAKAIHVPAFKINAGKQRRGHALLTLAKKQPCLL